MMRVIALVQARMGSTRFPGKMLANLGGHPILEWVLRRTNQACLIDQVVLATTDLNHDDPLVVLAHKLGFEIFRGSESDVLDRFATAASMYKADAVVRICADNPFIDADEIDRLVSHFKNNPCDYACNHQDRLGSRYADGFGAEIFSNSLLQQIAQVAVELKHREHATLYLWDHASEFCITAIPSPPELAYPELRFDIDLTQDLSNLEELVRLGVHIDSTAFEIVPLALNRSHATLVTTDVTYAPPNKGDTYFLGSWCFSSRKDERSAKAAGRIIPYHWDDREKLKSDFELLQGVNDELLKELIMVLNQLHLINQDERFWRLLLGYWLNIYTTVVFDRWASLKQAIKQRKKWKTDVFLVEENKLATNDTEEFIKKATESSSWNHSLFSLILRYMPEIRIDQIEANANEAAIAVNNPKKYATKQLLKKIVRNGGGRTKLRDRFFLITTYLPIKSMISLELALSQFPLPNFQFEDKIESEFDAKIRQWSLPPGAAKDEFNHIVRALLPKFIPKIFIEGFHDLMMVANKLPWAESPKVIFTSNRHFTDDVFKAWSAIKISRGARMLIGEHGGLGVGLFNGAHAYEVSVADTYLSAGWSNTRNEKILPIGNLRMAGRTIRPKPTGKALMVCVNMPRFAFDIRSMTLSSQILDYFEDQYVFIESLPANLRDQILIRLYPSDYGWEQKERWLDRHPEITFEESKLPLLRIEAESRLFIATYAATTYIDTLAVNFPTVIFWNPKLWEIKNEAQPIFVLLKEAGIFHETPQSAANHISRIWNNIPEWWESDVVQNARRSFCNEYSSMPIDLIGTVKKVLLDEAARSAIGESR
ncbi:MAG: LIC12162 family protein [Thiothrix sp.]|uniref:LIC12162 family transferase n=1 Tax=Thiothrix sp. TaxID=1032 RepID=UPI00260C60DA|nr:LIC12162 family protein [Thiothrix sp.]MDD5392917.1 LIC12162 family protein [Thiothrix sp.]